MAGIEKEAISFASRRPLTGKKPRPAEEGSKFLSNHFFELILNCRGHQFSGYDSLSKRLGRAKKDASGKVT